MYLNILLVSVFITVAAAATITTTPPPTTTTTYAWDTYEDLYPNRVKNECQGDDECPVYHYCFYSHWAGAGAKCLTEYEETQYNYHGVETCKRTNPDTGAEWPDHKVCIDGDDRPNDPAYSISRCFEGLGYKCAKAFMAPCTPNHDADGNLITGQEESCPDNFTCESVTWDDGDARVCVPVPAEDHYHYAQECETNYDCGFSRLEVGWPRCVHNWCSRMVG